MGATDIAASRLQALGAQCMDPSADMPAFVYGTLIGEHLSTLAAADPDLAAEAFARQPRQTLQDLLACQNAWVALDPRDMVGVTATVATPSSWPSLFALASVAAHPTQYLYRLRTDLEALASFLPTGEIERLKTLLPSPAQKAVLADALRSVDRRCLSIAAGTDDPLSAKAGATRAIARMDQSRRLDAVRSLSPLQRGRLARLLDSAELEAEQGLDPADVRDLLQALGVAPRAASGPAPHAVSGPPRPMHDDDDTACKPVVHAAGSRVGAALAAGDDAPEPSSGYQTGRRVVTTHSYMVVSANIHASQAGCEVLKAGGHAADAAVAVQAVLSLVEPQSSGLGGGTMLLHHDASRPGTPPQVYDGRETAPAAATDHDLRDLSPTERQSSGLSIGIPGAVRALDLLHIDHGTLPWHTLLEPAIRLADNGFPIGGRLATAIAHSTPRLLADDEAASVYFDHGEPKREGSTLRVPAYAQALRTLADNGANAFYDGPVAHGIVEEINGPRAIEGQPIAPGRATLADLARYEARRRDPLCVPYRDARDRDHWVCGLPPPSSGGLVVAQALGMLSHLDIGSHGPTDVDLEGGRPSVMGVHLISETERLAYADRDRYVADPAHVAPPGGSWLSLVDPDYLARRAGRVDPMRSMGRAEPGDFGSPAQGSDATIEGGTTHVSIVDAQGNAVVMTSSVEQSFGSAHMTQGMVLNNELLDFSLDAQDAQGRPIANRMEPGKRPRSSMAPTLVFARAADGAIGELELATGSPNGGTIPQYVVKTVVGALDWGLDAQQATSLVNVGAANGPATNVGGEHPNVDAALTEGLQRLGHAVNTQSQTSGTATVIRLHRGTATVLQGGADPRREGVALGDALR